MSGDKMENQFEGWLAQWEAAAHRYDELTHRLADPAVLSQPPVVIACNKERADLEDVSQLFADYRRLLQEIANTSRMLDDPQLDPELKALATDELGALQEQRTRVEERALQLLHPRNAEDDKNSFVEIRAGTGGEEAGLFAGELLRMYMRYAENRGLRVQMIDANETGIGGIKEAIFLVEGQERTAPFDMRAGCTVFKEFRVRRASGRIHTSTATVAVMPEVEDVDVHLDPRIFASIHSVPRAREVRASIPRIRLCE